jgi:protein TonB
MSPAALALAVGLHVLVAASLWWAAAPRRHDHAETPIMISIDPQPLSAGTASPPASSPSEALLPETAPSQTTPADPAPVDTQSTPEAQREATAAPAVPKPAEPDAVPEPTPPDVVVAKPVPVEEQTPAPVETATAAPQPPTEAETEAAWQTDASSWKPQVTMERPPAPPPPLQVRPAPRPPSTARTAQTPGTRLQDYPPQTSSLGGPSSGSFDQAMGDGGARNDYLSRVYRHIDPYRDYPAAARAARQHGRVVTRVTINRAGELLDIRLDRSSGWPLIDNAEMAAIRRAMPLPPVPTGMRGDPIVLVLPMNY